MAKGQKRSNREAKKPKQPKAERGASLPAALTPEPSARERPPVGSRNRNGARDGRR